MNCAHVLGLIDAGPCADYPAAHLDAAWRHAHRCPSCGPALAASTILTRELAGLSHADPPAHLATSIAARIARLDAPVRATGEARRGGRLTAGGWWPAVSTVAGGVIAAVALMGSPPPGPWAALSFEALRAGWMGMGPMVRPASTEQMLALAGGIVLFVGGLFVSRDLARRVR